ncbi:MAG: DUF2066 domain-containing protein [Alphaproteobacteria bacterium]|jgi:hypothetical protein|nr:DUF2066 domain-containing protein [Alphaproteobacteria bacterium]MDP6564338.1 DUF2066 domain-containing protein [Alphaproteobacteria bacterium]MDP6815140.1 DUF2066 domain-containing protein [Alphaproteobacteria bacterium]
MRLGGATALLAACLCAAAAGAALAQTSDAGDVFSVAGLAVDASAESAVVARQQALRDGQRRALRRVLRRITLREDHARLPDPDDQLVAQLVETLGVDGEKTSAVRYLARLNVRFNRMAMRRLLRGGNLAFSETRAKPTLVLPVFEKAGAVALFEDGNAWREAWGRLELPADTLLPLLLPLGDLQDITTIGADTALSGDSARLGEIGQRYGVENVLVAHAALRIDLGAGGIPRVRVNLLKFTSRGSSTVISDHQVEVGEDLEAAMDRLARQVALGQEEDWKRRTLLTFDSEDSLSARVRLRRLADWLAVRRRLARSAMVRSIALQSISRHDAQVLIGFLGDPDRLVVSLAQRDLELALVDGFWELRLLGGEAEAPGRGDGETGKK